MRTGLLALCWFSASLPLHIKTLEMKKLRLFLVLAVAGSFFTSCTLQSRSYKSPNYYVEFVKSDFEFSAPESGEATSTTIFGLDFSRLFKKDVGIIDSDMRSTFSIPIIGSLIKPNRVHSYALYNIMLENPGYDVIIYPRYEVKKTGIPFIFVTTTVKATVRLGKVK